MVIKPISFINSVWKLIETTNMSSSEALMLLSLTHQLNDNHWEQPFRTTLDGIKMKTKLDKRTISNALKKLSNMNLITYKNHNLGTDITINTKNNSINTDNILSQNDNTNINIHPRKVNTNTEQIQDTLSANSVQAQNNVSDTLSANSVQAQNNVSDTLSANSVQGQNISFMQTQCKVNANSKQKCHDKIAEESNTNAGFQAIETEAPNPPNKIREDIDKIRYNHNKIREDKPSPPTTQKKNREDETKDDDSYAEKNLKKLPTQDESAENFKTDMARKYGPPPVKKETANEESCGGNESVVVMEEKLVPDVNRRRQSNALEGASYRKLVAKYGEDVVLQAIEKATKHNAQFNEVYVEKCCISIIGMRQPGTFQSSARPAAGFFGGAGGENGGAAGLAGVGDPFEETDRWYAKVIKEDPELAEEAIKDLPPELYEKERNEQKRLLALYYPEETEINANA